MKYIYHTLTLMGGIRMEIKLLQTFSTVAKTNSFSDASKLLGYAQPTITTHIQLLENELDAKLFERLGHKIRLTSKGEQLLYYSENILKYSSEAIANLKTNNSISGKLTVGANESFSVARLPIIFNHFINNYPDVDLSLKFGSVNEIHSCLQNNTVDVAFFLTHEVSFSDLTTETLLSEEVVMAASPTHPFCRKQHLSITDLNNQVLILTQKNCTFRSMIDTIIEQTQLHPHSIIEINNIEAIKQLTASGLGITIIPRISILHEIEQGLLIELPWIGPQLPVYTQLAYHKDKWLSPTITKFLEESRKISLE